MEKEFLVPGPSVLSDRTGMYSSGMPRIDKMTLDCAVFLFRTVDEARSRVRLGGTASIISKYIEGSREALGKRLYTAYLVSNRHVVWNSGAVVASVNRRDGNAPDVWDIDQNDWVVHPDGTDLAAVCVDTFIEEAIHKFIHHQDFLLLTKERLEKYQVGVGDEVYMIGRFLNHQGRVHNETAARFGTISMMAAPIWNSATSRDEESFAVEMRSRTGFSGSPVWFYRTPATSLVAMPHEIEQCEGLLGINWGYINDPETDENTWLNGVIPAWKILELLETPELKKKHDEVSKRELSRRGGAATPASESPSPANGENPTHREDFTRLLGAAVKTPQPKD